MSFLGNIGFPTYEDFEAKSSDTLKRIRIDHKIGLAGAEESLKHLPPSSVLGHWGAIAAIRRFKKELGWIDEILSKRAEKGEEE
jgi:hypothetical protein